MNKAHSIDFNAEFEWNDDFINKIFYDRIRICHFYTYFGSEKRTTHAELPLQKEVKSVHPMIGSQRYKRRENHIWSERQKFGLIVFHFVWMEHHFEFVAMWNDKKRWNGTAYFIELHFFIVDPNEEWPEEEQKKSRRIWTRVIWLVCAHALCNDLIHDILLRLYYRSKMWLLDFEFICHFMYTRQYYYCWRHKFFVVFVCCLVWWHG